MSALDEGTFEQLASAHRRELHVHCYRMLGSFDDAEDAVQEVFLRAWGARDRYEGRDLARAWLYRIATNVCLDAIRRRKRRPVDLTSFAEVPWLQPYPDPLLDEAAVARETVELAFVAALQALPPRQRAALVARDVLGWPAVETAAHLGTSVPAANSAVQRARAKLQELLPAERGEWSMPVTSEEERDVLARFIAAHEQHDVEGALALAAADIRVTMPPLPLRYDGRDAIAPLLERAFGPEHGDWRLLPAGVNRMPAAASYARQPGDSLYRPMKLDVLRVADGRIAEITTFGPQQFGALGLPPTISSP